MAALATPAPDLAVKSQRERVCLRVLRVIAGLVALGLLGHLVVLLWAQHDFTPVEALVVLHSRMFAHGEGLYWGLHHYPYTISAYGPVFYAAAALLQTCGVPAYQSARVISFAALITALWLCWLCLGYLGADRYARATAVLLAASSSNVLFWGTTGQVDLLGCCFSLAAFAAFLKFREQGSVRALAFAGILVLGAIFTKQTFVAAGAAIALTLLREDRKRAAGWIAAVGVACAAIAFALNAATHGGFFGDAIFANLNPFAWSKLQQHAQYFILTGGGLILTAAAGAWNASRRTQPAYLYAALAAGVWLLTAPKIGSDLNYQIEMTLALCVCAGAALQQLEFFPSLFTARRTSVTLLQMPLLLHAALGVLLTARIVAERAIFEPYKRQETAALRTYVDRPGRLLSVQYDAQLHYRGRIEVEPLIYSLLVRAGLTDPAPLLRDLDARRFATVILAQNIFAPASSAPDPEQGTLPEAQLEAIRNHYRLIRHLEGPNSVYIYEPKQD